MMIQAQVRTALPGPGSQALISEVGKIFPSAQYAGLYGIALRSGKGMYLTDIDGNTYLDFIAGASAVSLGYDREDVVAAYTEAARRIQHTCFVYSPNPEAVALARKLIEITPGSFSKQVLFGLSGSDSIDAAIKIARRATGRPAIISFRKGYHGSTGYSIGANGFGSLQQGLYIGPDFQKIQFPMTPEQAELSLSAVEDLLKKGNIAAVVAEPIQGDGGNIQPPDHFHRELIDLVHRYGALYIVDEIQTGIGRSGSWWAIETFGVTPDILCTGKGITGGYIPLSACIAREELAKSLGKAQHLFTYSGQPPACAVALKVIEVIEKEELRDNAKERGCQLKHGLQELINTSTGKMEVRGRGLHIGLAAVESGSRLPLGGLIAFRCVEKGLYTGYFGEANEVVRLHPPLIVNPEEIEFAVETIGSVIEECEKGKIPSSTIQRYERAAIGLGAI